MSLKKLEKLEKLVDDYVTAIHKMQEDKKYLAKEVKNLKSELKSLSQKYERANAHLKKITQLENANRKMESEKTLIRTKIKNVLSDLEQIDII